MRAYVGGKKLKPKHTDMWTSEISTCDRLVWCAKTCGNISTLQHVGIGCGDIPLGALRYSGACKVLISRFPGCPWLPLAVPGCSWPAPDCSRLLLAAPGLLLAAHGCSWLPLAAPGCLWLLLTSTVDPKKTTCLGS
jgi:hypothetical protein